MKSFLLLIFSCFYSISILASDNINFTKKTIIQDQENPKYTINIEYPQITNQSLTLSQKKFNNLINQWVNNHIADFKKTLQNNEKYPIPEKIKKNGSSMTVNYDLITIEPNLFISLRFNTDSNFVGAAHPSHKSQSINYSLTQNKEISLSDLFKAHSNFLEKISNYSIQHFKPKFKQGLFADNLSPYLKNYEIWNITPQGLLFTFNEYQIAAYYFGQQKVTIPYTYIKDLMSNKTEVGKCIQNSKDCKIQVVVVSEKNNAL